MQTHDLFPLNRLDIKRSLDPIFLFLQVNNIRRHQIWLQLCRTFGQHDALSVEEQLTLADSIVEFYERTAPISAQMVPTDIR